MNNLLLFVRGDIAFTLGERRIGSPLAAILVTMPIVTACEVESGGLAMVVRRDSAGIEIVESSRRVLPAPVFATVDTIPIVEVGVVAGDSMYELFQVMDAQRLDDGRLVILNGGTQEFRIFNADGTFAYAFGGPGEGPGEFGYAREFVVEGGDTLVTMDVQQWERNWFNLDGSFLGSQRVDRTPYRAETLFLAPAGQGLVFLWGPYEPRPGLHRQDMALALVDSTGEHADTLGWYGALENYTVDMGNRLLNRSRPFGRDTRYATGRERVYVGDSDEFTIQVFDATGTLTRVIRLINADVAVAPSDRSAYEEEMREWARQNPEYRAYTNRFLADVPWPTYRPAFGPVGAFTEDREGNLWVQRYKAPRDVLRTFEVFDSTGAWRGVVELPESLEPLDIGTDYVVARRRDAVDAEYVGVFSLQHR